jgi:hypothetical protein
MLLPVIAIAKNADVIPAEAGIHLAFGIQRRMYVTRRPWAPAFAGVTLRVGWREG